MIFYYSSHNVVFIEKQYYNIFVPFRAGSMTMSSHFTGRHDEVTTLRHAVNMMQRADRTNVIVVRNPVERFRSAHLLLKYSTVTPSIVCHFWPVYRYLVDISCKIIPFDKISSYVAKDYNPYTSILSRNVKPDVHYPSLFKKEVEAVNYLYNNREVITPEEFNKIC